MYAKNIVDAYPLSPLQEGLLFHSLYAPESGVYITQLACTLRNVNVAAFTQAWQYVVDRHVILRTAFAWQSVEKPLQVVGRRVQLPLAQHDWHGLTPTAQEEQCAAYLHADRRRGFQLSKAPLMRLALFRVGRDTYTFVWSYHHVLLDGWSVSLLLQEVLVGYEAFSCGQHLQFEAPRPYRDYIAWLQQQDLSASERFWRTRLQAVEARTLLARALSLQQPGSGHGTWRWQLSAAQTQALQRCAQAERLTLNTVVQGVWTLLLQRYTGQRTVVFGATVAGRPASLPGAEQMIGLFINTLPAVQSPPLGQAVGVWLRALQADTVALREYEHTPLYEIQRWAGQGGQALFDTLLVFENYPVDVALRAPEARAYFSDVRTVATTNYALTVSVTVGETLEMRFDYARAQFDASAVAQLSAHCAHLLAQVVEDPARAVGDLELLTAQEWEQVAAWNTLPQRFAPDMPVPAWMCRQAQTQPEAVALVYEEQQLTYEMLERRANQLAQRLVRLGVGPEVRVGLSVERSLEMVVGMLGIWKAGGAYVPLDPVYPSERLAYMLADAGVALLVTQSTMQERLPVPDGMLCVVLEDATLDEEPATAPAVTLAPEHLAYVLYTSGSTGTPKGVAVAHGALSMHCQAMGELYGMTPEDRALHFASLSVDAAVEQWVVPLMHGACLVLRGPEFWSPEQAVAALSAHGITRLDVPPAYATELAPWLRTRGTALALRTCTVGGEAVVGASVTLLQHACQPATILNAYGPTEAVITPLVWVAADTGCTTVYAPIGTTVGERTTYILHAARRVVPVGVVGELYIGGTGLARGYHGQPGLTAEHFVPDPFSIVPGRRLYRTGDLARWQADGTIEYVGRVDDQVKIRGFRIELGEIEAVLQTHAAITAAVVVARDAGVGQAIGPAGGSAVGPDEAFHDQRLVAYLVTEQHALPLHSALRNFLHEKLPDYMVPALFVRLDALPLTPNGKVDRRALPVPESWRPESAAAYVAPRTEIQRLIATIWQEVLHVEQVGIHDNFFDLGGHSLLMTKVWHTLRTRLHQDLAMLDLFQYPTVHALATYLSQEHQAPRALQLADDRDDTMHAGKSRLKQQLLQRQRATNRGLTNA
jgi:amino acid adenylation domain-containing protein